MARDRDGGYARAVSRALPNAVQVADRWHLLDNCGKAFLAAVRRLMPDIRKAFGSRAIDPGLLTGAERLLHEGFLRRQQTNSTVRRIGRRQSADQADRPHDRIEPQSRSPDPARRTRGCLPATPEQSRAVAALAHEGMGKRLPEWRRTVAPSSRKGVRGKPAHRRRVGDTTAARDHLSRSDAVTVARIEAAVPDLAAACALTGRFANMVRNGEHDNLEEWLSEAGGSLLASLARGLNADKHPVLAALREPWSNGQTEGQINKLKALKRQMYGRGNLDLLRARLIAAA